MAEMFKPQSKEVIQSWIDALLDEASDELTDWESKFIADMQIAILAWGKLTEAQQDKLESIYAAKTG